MEKIRFLSFLKVVHHNAGGNNALPQFLNTETLQRMGTEMTDQQLVRIVDN